MQQYYNILLIDGKPVPVKSQLDCDDYVTHCYGNVTHYDKIPALSGSSEDLVETQSLSVFEGDTRMQNPTPKIVAEDCTSQMQQPLFPNARKRWTQHDNDSMFADVKSGIPFGEVALKYGRTESAIKIRVIIAALDLFKDGKDYNSILGTSFSEEDLSNTLEYIKKQERQVHEKKCRNGVTRLTKRIEKTKKMIHNHDVTLQKIIEKRSRGGYNKGKYEDTLRGKCDLEESLQSHIKNLNCTIELCEKLGYVL